MYLKKFVLILLKYYLNSQTPQADAGCQEVADLATRLLDLKRAGHLLWFSTGFQKHLFGWLFGEPILAVFQISAKKTFFI